MKHYYFYKTINLVNSKYYYGVHQTTNLYDGYLGSGKLLKKAVKKYGRINFKKIILAIFDNKQEMYDYEKFFITEKIILDNQSYNLVSGGIGGISEETRIKISNSLKGNQNSATTKLGKPRNKRGAFSIEHKRKISHIRCVPVLYLRITGRTNTYPSAAERNRLPRVSERMKP